MEEIRQLLVDILARQSRLEGQQHLTLRALREIVQGVHDMSKMHDDIAAALSANASTGADIDKRVDELAAMKDESDAAFSDILSTVQAQGTELAATKAKLDSALGATGSSTPPSTPEPGPSGGTETETEDTTETHQ